MDKATRIDLIRESAELLAQRHWADIDLVLREFGLPVFSDWHEDQLSYCLTAIRDASNDDLRDLHAYLRQERPTDHVGEASWETNQFRLFLSHVSAEKVFVHEVKQGLLDFGIGGFVAHDDIEPSSEWQNAILAALATCDALAAFLHDGFPQSSWTDQEVGFVIGRGVPVLGLRFADYDPYGFMGRWQGAPCRGLTAAAVAAKIYAMLRARKELAQRLETALIQAVVDSRNFDEANRRAGRLGDVEGWSPEKLDLLATALENFQVEGAWHAKPRIKGILSEHGRG